MDAGTWAPAHSFSGPRTVIMLAHIVQRFQNNTRESRGISFGSTGEDFSLT